MLKLPPGVTIKKDCKDDGDIIYRIERFGTEIGGFTFMPTPGGNTQIKPYVCEAKQPEPYKMHTELVAKVVRDVGDGMLAIKSQYTSPEAMQDSLMRDRMHPDFSHESKMFPCTRCNKVVGKLIFPGETLVRANDIEKFAEKIKLEYQNSPYPVWIIGGPDSMADDAKHLTLKVCPAAGKPYWESPDKMNARLCELDDKHC